ncbi:MAG: type II toxin-antitoxin system YafQ family toxin [Alteromonadaceae bacterium]|nr:type II toxin-antitoxin system YafQ family toxin [Alteromonadaceae bacterium]
MKLKIRTKNTFKKDLKKALKNPKQDTNLLKVLINEELILTGTVPKKYHPHLLSGNWKPHMECHIQPDFLLIWDVDSKNNELILFRCGFFTELFG